MNSNQMTFSEFENMMVMHASRNWKTSSHKQIECKCPRLFH